MSEETSLIGREQKEIAARDRDNRAAFIRIRENDLYRPLNVLVQESFAAEIEPLLRGLDKLRPDTRALAYRVLDYYKRKQGAKFLSKQQCAKDLGVPYYSVLNLEKWWPRIWEFNNALARHELETAMAMVDRATMAAAVDGTHKDRELYYKLTGRLKQESRGGGGTIIFVNDQLQRPMPTEKVVEAQRVQDDEPSPPDDDSL